MIDRLSTGNYFRSFAFDRALVTLFSTCVLACFVSIDHELNVQWVRPNIAIWLFALRVLPVFFLLALPMFLLLAKLRFLKLWQVLLAGLVCSLLLGWWLGWYEPIAGLARTLWSAARCTMAAYLFWLVGLWRNPRFPFIAGAPLKAVVFLVPVWALLIFGCYWFMPRWVHGEVLSLHDIHHYETAVTGILIVKLDKSGQIVAAPMMYPNVHAPAPGDRTQLYERPTLLNPREHRYWSEYVTSPTSLRLRRR